MAEDRKALLHLIHRHVVYNPLWGNKRVGSNYPYFPYQREMRHRALKFSFFFFTPTALCTVGSTFAHTLLPGLGRDVQPHFTDEEGKLWGVMCPEDTETYGNLPCSLAGIQFMPSEPSSLEVGLSQRSAPTTGLVPGGGQVATQLGGFPVCIDVFEALNSSTEAFINSPLLGKKRKGHRLRNTWSFSYTWFSLVLLLSWDPG